MPTEAAKAPPHRVLPSPFGGASTPSVLAPIGRPRCEIGSSAPLRDMTHQAAPRQQISGIVLRAYIFLVNSAFDCRDPSINSGDGALHAAASRRLRQRSSGSSACSDVKSMAKSPATTDSQVVRKTWTQLPFSVFWRTAIVRLPRLAPRLSLRITNPKGPYPFVVKIPSRYGLLISVWVYLPPRDKIVHPDGLVAVHLDFRGGGFYMGSCVEQGPFCAKIARERGCVVICPDHGLGPFRQFPAALEDSEDALSAILDIEQQTDAGKVLHRAINDHFLPSAGNYRKRSQKRAASELRIDVSRLSLSGFSSGGNLALNLVTSTKSDDGDWPCRIPETSSLIPVLLFYPAVHQKELPEDRPRKPGVPRPGWFARGLDKYLVRSYLPEDMTTHPRANPGLADPSQLHPNARLFVVISGVDTLVDQIEAWIARLDEAGRHVETFRATDMKHGYVNMPARLLSRRSIKMKGESYRRMQDFWDRTAEEVGFPRDGNVKSEAEDASV